GVRRYRRPDRPSPSRFADRPVLPGAGEGGDGRTEAGPGPAAATGAELLSGLLRAARWPFPDENPPMLHAVVLCLCSAVSAAPVDADLVIKGATLYDGHGGEGVKGDLALKGERIVGVGSFEVKGTPRI